MRLSRNFVNDYIDLSDVSTLEIANKMLKIGNEYDSVKKLIDVENPEKLVVGKVIECNPHPESDHLNVCKVDIGNEILNIICGAPNVRKNLKVIVALDGCILPGGVIKKTTILGRESNGMLCSFAELGIENKFLKKEEIYGIHELEEDAEVGVQAIKYLEMDDEIIDFELTANRADELSMLGLAYEVGSIIDRKVTLPPVDYKENEENISKSLKLKVETDNVYTFLAKKVNNIVIKESPAFIKNRLIACNIRPINNVVDISNYVMLETGQPLHFYDASRLGKCIGIRTANEAETLTTLDSNKRILSQNDIVITNGEDAIGLAGVMGGLDTEIENDTKSVVIESAIFNPINIRVTSKKYLRSEASIRFEKTLDVNRCYLALERACYLLSVYASGSVCKGMLEYNTLSKDEKTISIKLDKINTVLGYTLSEEEVSEVFRKLDFKCSYSKGKFEVIVPTRRVDIAIEEDLIEEVGRIYGVDNIVGTLPVMSSIPANYNSNKRIVRDKMSSLGLNEVVTYSLINLNDVFKFTNDEFGLIKVLDPMTEERVVLRHSLITSLIEVYNYNKARNIKDIRIFELGNGFSSIIGNYVEELKLSALLTGKINSGLNNEVVDFYYIKGIVEELLDYLGYKNRYSFIVKDLPEEMHPTKSVYINVSGTIVGMFGCVHPNVIKEEVYVLEINLNTLFDIKTGKLKYKDFSKYPGISKDLAFILPKNVNSEDIIFTIKQSCGKTLKTVNVFDYYEGEKIEENKKSIAYNLYFESFDKTLTDLEVDPLLQKTIENVVKKHNGILRDK